MTDSPHTGDHTQSEAPSASPYIRLPLPAVAAAIFVLLAALLAFGLYANANLRPRGVIMPTPPAVQSVAATGTPSAGAAPMRAGNTPIVTPTASSEDSGATPTVVRVGLGLTTPTAASSNATGGPSPVALATVATPPSLDPVRVSEVTTAFYTYWDVRAQALLDLDKTHLEEVMAGDHLQSFSQRIDQLRAENRAIKTDVNHEINVLSVSNESSQVVDDYISDSVYVDAVTRQQLSEPASDEIRAIYKLQKFDGVWKVIDSVQAD